MEDSTKSKDTITWLRSHLTLSKETKHFLIPCGQGSQSVV